MATPINELKSFTEYNVTTPTSVFTVGFEYTYNLDHINVYVDGVPAATAGYTVNHDSHGTLELHPAVPSGIVLLQRETNIDGMLHTFSAGAKFIAGNMDEDFKQLRHAQQEVRDEVTRTVEQFAILDANATAALDSANAAVATANSIDAKATTALSNSNTALSTANSANSTANTALTTANGIDAKATTALSNSSTALTTANTALSTANGIDAKATQAQSDAASALAVANTAIQETEKGVASGVATLDTDGKHVATQQRTASTTIAGVIEIATQGEVSSGVDSTRAIVPSTLKGGIQTHLNASGSAPMYACRAWVNFNGVPLNGTYSQSGFTITVTMASHGMAVGQKVRLDFTSGTSNDGTYTIATVPDASTFTVTDSVSATTSGNVTRQNYIRAWGNIDAIIYNGTGDFTIIFTTAMPTANYAVSEMHSSNSGQHAAFIEEQTASSLRVKFTLDASNSYPATNPVTATLTVFC